MNEQQCEFHAERRCRFAHKCKSLGCELHRTPEDRKMPTFRLPWEPTSSAKGPQG